MKYMVVGALAGMVSIFGVAAISWAVGDRIESVNKTSEPSIKVSVLCDNDSNNNKKDCSKSGTCANKSRVTRNRYAYQKGWERVEDGKEQEGPCWCWVASAQMLLKKKGIDVSQVDLYKAAVGEDAPAQREQRTRAGYPEDIAGAINNLHIGLNANYYFYHFSATDEQIVEGLKAMFKKHGALTCSIGGHWVTIIDENKDNNTFRIYDSLGDGGVFDVDCIEFCNLARRGNISADPNSALFVVYL